MSSDEFVEGGEGIDMFDPKDLDEAMAQFEGEDQKSEDEVRAMLERRRLAYKSVFTAGVRSQEDIDIVLADLMWFCRWREPSYDKRDGQHAEELSKRKEGRREVFIRIADFARLNFDTILLMYTNALTRK